MPDDFDWDNATPEETLAYFEERDRRSRDWTCPRCGVEYRMGYGIRVGTECCFQCGWPQDHPTYKVFGDDENAEARAWARAKRVRRGGHFG